MPIHDWTRVPPGTFHAFHVCWIGELQGVLNGGLLPDGYLALAEQAARDVGPDVLTRSVPGIAGPYAANDGEVGATGGGVAVATAPPTTSVQDWIADGGAPASRRRPLVIRHASTNRAVAVIDVVSPSNKSGPLNTAGFVGKATAIIDRGIHLQVLDLFPPGRSDPDGLHAAIWAELGGSFAAPAGRPLTLAAYEADLPVRCYVEPSAVGMFLADLPLFLTPGWYVNVPLERAYMAAYETMPRSVRAIIEGGSPSA